MKWRKSKKSQRSPQLGLVVPQDGAMSSTAADLPLGEGQGFLLPHSSSESQEMLQIFEHLFRPTGMCSMKSTHLARGCGTSGSEGLLK
jgi:hypothetical protein